MTFISAPGTSAPGTPSGTTGDADAASRRSMYRFAGWGAIVAAACYLAQPFIVLLASQQEEEWLSPADIESSVWQGPLGAAVFVGVGLGTLAAVVGLDRLIAPRVSDPGWRVTHLLGVVTAIGWLLMGGLSVGQYSTVARAMGDIGADLPTVQVGLQSGMVVITGVLAMAATAFAGWLVGLVRWGRRAGVIGRPAAVVALVAAAACLVPQLLWSQPFGMLAAIPALLVLGVALVRRAR